MKKTNILIILVVLMFFSFSVSPIKTYALNLYVEKPSREVSVGDTVLLKIYVDTKDSEINVVEGAVRVSNNVTITEAGFPFLLPFSICLCFILILLTIVFVLL